MWVLNAYFLCFHKKESISYMERNTQNFFHQTSSPWEEEWLSWRWEREKAQGPCSSVHWAFIFRWTCLLTSLFNTFSPTEAEPVPRPGVETGVGLERRLYSHISNRLLKSCSFMGIVFILGNQTLIAGQEIFSELVLLALNLIFSFYLSDSYIWFFNHFRPQSEDN